MGFFKDGKWVSGPDDKNFTGTYMGIPYENGRAFGFGQTAQEKKQIQDQRDFQERMRKEAEAFRRNAAGTKKPVGWSGPKITPMETKPLTPEELEAAKKLQQERQEQERIRNELRQQKLKARRKTAAIASSVMACVVALYVVYATRDSWMVGSQVGPVLVLAVPMLLIGALVAFLSARSARKRQAAKTGPAATAPSSPA